MQMEESVGTMRHSLASVLYWGTGRTPHPTWLNRHFQPHLALLTISSSKLPPLTAKFHLLRVFLHGSHTLLLFSATVFMPPFPPHAIASVLYVLEIIHPDNVHPFPISTSAQSPGSVKQPLSNPYNLECLFGSSRKQSCNTLSHNLGTSYNAPIFEGMAPSSFTYGQVSGICP